MSDGAYLLHVIRSRCTEEGNCLIWPGAMSAGRSPVLTFKGENVQIRRFIWTQMGKDLKPGKAIKVKCRDIRCVSEICLYEGLRGATAGIKRTVAHKAKMAAIIQAKSSLTMADVQAIRASDKPLRELCAEYGKAQRTIQNIIAGNTWAVSGVFAGLGVRKGAGA